jgi:hypothetical protein
LNNINYINKNEFQFNNINNWHKKGYTGKNIKIATIEVCNIDTWYLRNKVKDPFNNGKQALVNSHGNQTLTFLSKNSPIFYKWEMNC